MNRLLWVLLLPPLLLTACTAFDLGDGFSTREEELPRGLRDALVQGAATASRQAS